MTKMQKRINFFVNWKELSQSTKWDVSKQENKYKNEYLKSLKIIYKDDKLITKFFQEISKDKREKVKVLCNY